MQDDSSKRRDSRALNVYLGIAKGPWEVLCRRLGKMPGAVLKEMKLSSRICRRRRSQRRVVRPL